jgi:sodium/proline symporter
LLNWFFVAPALRRRSAETGAITLTEFIAGQARGARVVRVVASLIVLASLGLYVAAQLCLNRRPF